MKHHTSAPLFLGNMLGVLTLCVTHSRASWMCRWGSVLCLGIMGVLAGSTGVTAAAAAPTVNDAQAEGTLQAPLVDWSHAQQVYRLAEGWLHQGDPGDRLDGPVIEVSGLTGVRVTVRWLGMRMGTGQASFETVAPTRGQARDLTEMTRHAMRGAMLEINEKLMQARQRGQDAQADQADQTTQADQAPKGDQAAPPAPSQMTIASLAGQWLLDIQIAGPLTPLSLQADAPPDALYHAFAPGHHGLRLTSRASDGTMLASWLWPSDSLASGLSPQNQIHQLMGGLGLKLNQANQIARPGGPALASFQVIHMVRAGRHQPITRLVRGNVLLPPTSIDGRTLEAMMVRLADHLVRRQREDGSFTGSYSPSTDTYQSPASSDHDAALACLALTRWATDGQAVQEATPAQIDAAKTAVRRWADANLARLLNPDQQPGPATLALALLILTDTPELASRQVQRDMLANRLLRLRGEDGALRRHEDPQAQAVDMPVAALMVNAMAAYYAQSRSETVAAALPATMNWLWRQIDPLRSFGALPWLLEADARLEAFTDAQGANPLSPRSARGVALARLLPVLEVVRSRQVVTPPAVGPADVIGGFELREPDPLAPPNPDWRTAHALMVLSQCLRHPDLSLGRPRVDDLLVCGRAARFLGQLMFDEPGAYYVRHPPDVVGGVRAVLWDNQLDLAPTAMALLASQDLRRTLRQWATP